MTYGGLQPLADALRAGDAVLRDAGMEPAALQFGGTAFFPVGRGLVAPGDHTIRNKPVMVLGQDFGTVAYVQQRVANGQDDEVNSTTWRELNHLLPKAGIPLASCFFTNAYLGLRREGAMVGALPAIRNDAYRTWCEEFWTVQFSEQRPALIVALGKEPTRFLGRIVPELKAWNTSKPYAHLLQQDQAILPSKLGGHRCTAVTIPHPSFLHANAGRCRWGGATGRQALELLLQEAYRRSTTPAEPA